MTLQRIDRTYRGKPTHHYTLDGKKVPGVTTLLSGGLPKPALVNWASRSVAEWVADNPDRVRQMLDEDGRESIVNALKSKPWDSRDDAAARGTEIHALAERIIHGDAVEVPEHLHGPVTGYVAWLDAWGVEPILTERACASRTWWYAGTFDAVLRFTRGERAGRVDLVDWKTSRGVYGESALQLAAYQHADFYLDDDGVEQPMPDVDGLAVVHITPTGTDLYAVADPDGAWKSFTHVQYVAKRIDSIKSHITEPTPMPQGVHA